MSTLEVVAWLALLVVLASLFVVVLRRMSQLVARTRDLERFQREVVDLDSRVDGVVMPLLGQLDRIKRRSGDPVAAASQLAETLAVVAEATARSRALRAPATLIDRTAAITWELERAGRALELLDHALSGLASVRGPREQEIQTALKRGGLNLRHARDAIHVIALELARVHPVDLAPPGLRVASRGQTAAPEASPATVAGGPPSDPIM